MDTDRTVQAKRAFDTLYAWIFPASSSSSPSSSSAASAAASSIISQAASAASFLHKKSNLDIDYSEPAYKETVFRTLSHSLAQPFHFLKHWNPEATFDSILWNYTPDIHALQQRLGLEHLSETYNIDPRLLLLVVVLPPVMLLLVVYVAMRPSHVSDRPDDIASYRRTTDPADVTKASVKEEHTKQSGVGKGPASYLSSKKGAKGSAKTGGAKDNAGAAQHRLRNTPDLSSWSMMLGSAGLYGGQIMAYDAIDVHVVQKDAPAMADTEANSWGSRMGALGFFGPETSTFAPYKNLAGKDLGQLLDGDSEATTEGLVKDVIEQDQMRRNSRGSDVGAKRSLAPELTNYTPYKNLTGKDLGRLTDGTAEDDTVRTEAGIESTEAVGAENGSIVSTPVEEKHIKTTKMSKKARKAAKAAKAEVIKTAEVIKEDIVDKAAEITPSVSSFTQHPAPSVAKTEPTDQRAAVKSTTATTTTRATPALRTRTPRSSSSLKESDLPKALRLTRANQDLGSKILGYAQESQLLKNVDMMSGGILGPAVATVAALVTISEATAGLIKDNLPESVTNFAGDLKESFDHAMRVEDVKEIGSSDGETWGIRRAVSQIIQEDNHAASNYISSSSSRKPAIEDTSTTMSVATPATPTATPAAPTARNINRAEDVTVDPKKSFASVVAAAAMDVDEVSAADGVFVSANASHSRAHSVTKETLADVDQALEKAQASFGDEKLPKTPTTSTAAGVATINKANATDRIDPVASSYAAAVKRDSVSEVHQETKEAKDDAEDSGEEAKAANPVSPVAFSYAAAVKRDSVSEAHQETKEAKDDAEENGEEANAANPTAPVISYAAAVKRESVSDAHPEAKKEAKDDAEDSGEEANVADPTAPVSYAAAVKRGSVSEAHQEAKKEAEDDAQDSGEEADDDEPESEYSDDENADDGSTHFHRLVSRSPGSRHHHHPHHHGHHLVVHPHDEVKTNTHHAPAIITSDKMESHLSMEHSAGAQEFTVDEYGNKVAVADVRRDSGFDMVS